MIRIRASNVARTKDADPAVGAKSIRLTDPDIVSKAAQEKRVVLTFDLDFGDLLAAGRTEAPSVIILRLRNQTPAAVNPRLFRVISQCESELSSGAVIIVEDDRYRVRRLPIRKLRRFADRG